MENRVNGFYQHFDFGLDANDLALAQYLEDGEGVFLSSEQVFPQEDIAATCSVPAATPTKKSVFDRADHEHLLSPLAVLRRVVAKVRHEHEEWKKSVSLRNGDGHHDAKAGWLRRRMERRAIRNAEDGLAIMGDKISGVSVRQSAPENVQGDVVQLVGDVYMELPPCPPTDVSTMVS